MNTAPSSCLVVIGLIVLSVSGSPVWGQSQEDDFTRHNRFDFAKNYCPKEQDRLPVLHEPPHNVQSGDMKMAPLPTDLLQQDRVSPPIRPPEMGAVYSTKFGHPAPSARTTNSPTSKQSEDVQTLKSIPDRLANKRHQLGICEPAAPSSVQTVTAVPVRDDLPSHKPRTAKPVIGRLSQSHNDVAEAASYPSGVGYTYSAPGSTLSSGSNQALVHGEILQPH
jgi:hypothetical protein